VEKRDRKRRGVKNDLLEHPVRVSNVGWESKSEKDTSRRETVGDRKNQIEKHRWSTFCSFIRIVCRVEDFGSKIGELIGVSLLGINWNGLSLQRGNYSESSQTLKFEFSSTN
jgi:hypothetical protein